MGRILALDYGTKRVGVAVSDESRKIAFPRAFIPTAEKGKLIKLIKEQGIDQIVVGLPRNLSGQETESAEKARKFASWLERSSNLQVEFLDERFSTKEASNKLREIGVKSKAAKTKIDSMSACIILQAYLNKNQNV
ncbi:MAG: Holliday junction resolvase RuvX [bacterium]|nr:Holliday junction resolvase RuvX [bacterium]